MPKKTPSAPSNPRKAPAPARTDSGPATTGAPPGADPNSPAARQADEAEALAAGMPFNSTKPAEHGFDNGVRPPAGFTVEPPSRLPTASTLSEAEGTDKTGSIAVEGLNSTIDSLDRVRVDSGGQPLTTNQGVRVGDNQNSLKDGVRGPVLLEDFILREKVTHFDHERIPERIVHARGSGAHGFFECYEALTDLTRAAPFQAAGK